MPTIACISIITHNAAFVRCLDRLRVNFFLPKLRALLKVSEVPYQYLFSKRDITKHRMPARKTWEIETNGWSKTSRCGWQVDAIWRKMTENIHLKKNNIILETNYKTWQLIYISLITWQFFFACSERACSVRVLCAF